MIIVTFTHPQIPIFRCYYLFNYHVTEMVTFSDNNPNYLQMTSKYLVSSDSTKYDTLKPCARVSKEMSIIVISGTYIDNDPCT